MSRDMTEPKPTTPAEARKKVKEAEERDPTGGREHYRDDLTVTDEANAGMQETNPQGEENQA